MPPKKRTRSVAQEEKKAEHLTLDGLYAVFGYNDDLIYVPLKVCSIYLPGSQFIAQLANAPIGLKRPHYTVFNIMSKLSIYKTEKPTSERRALPLASLTFTTDERKHNTPLDTCWISAPYFDGQKFTCKADQIVVTTEPGGKTFMLKECFFHEEFTRLTYMSLKKGKKMPDNSIKVHDIERTQSDDPPHSTMYI